MLENNLHACVFIFNWFEQELDLLHVVVDLGVKVYCVFVQQVFLLLSLFFNFAQSGLLSVLQFLLKSRQLLLLFSFQVLVQLLHFVSVLHKHVCEFQFSFSISFAVLALKLFELAFLLRDDPQSLLGQFVFNFFDLLDPQLVIFIVNQLLVLHFGFFDAEQL